MQDVKSSIYNSEILPRRSRRYHHDEQRPDSVDLGHVVGERMCSSLRSPRSASFGLGFGAVPRHEMKMFNLELNST
jgi:hypothetical protein